MRGKVTLENHFAIDATLGDSQPFGAHVWPELRHRPLDFQERLPPNGRIQHRDGSLFTHLTDSVAPGPARAG
jgi:hypothetical protein